MCNNVYNAVAVECTQYLARPPIAIKKSVIYALFRPNLNHRNSRSDKKLVAPLGRSSTLTNSKRPTSICLLVLCLPPCLLLLHLTLSVLYLGFFSPLLERQQCSYRDNSIKINKKVQYIYFLIASYFNS